MLKFYVQGFRTEYCAVASVINNQNHQRWSWVIEETNGNGTQNEKADSPGNGY